MEKKNGVGHVCSFIDYDLEFIKKKLLKTIEMRVSSETYCLSLSVSIDGTQNTKGVTMSRAYKCLFGGVFPNHIIQIDGLEEDVIKNIILNKNKEIQDAYKIKIAVITFQQYRKGEKLNVTIAGRTQSNNYASDFN